jgi:ribosome-interacting GTPase 1
MKGKLQMITIPQSVLDGISAVWDSGQVNMFDRNTVAKICSDMGFFDAAVWIAENRTEYAQGIFQGFKAVEEVQS